MSDHLGTGEGESCNSVPAAVSPTEAPPAVWKVRGCKADEKEIEHLLNTEFIGPHHPVAYLPSPDGAWCRVVGRLPRPMMFTGPPAGPPVNSPLNDRGPSLRDQLD